MTETRQSAMPGRTRPPKKKSENRISTAIRRWAREHHQPANQTPPASAAADAEPDPIEPAENRLVAEGPKGWVVYEPMVLLPSGSFQTAAWTAALAPATEQTRSELWRGILREVSVARGGGGGELTHLAVTEGIPPSVERGDGAEEEEEKTENVLRSPSRLRILHGDFGPAALGAGTPTAADLDAAFWVSTTQNGIFQTWAPRWTMFSRGNVKEKARLLSFARRDDRGGGAGPARGGSWAVDLYAGIGYFAFPYARLGMRVLCWEINPWSVEGLRRGAARNGWGVRVVREGEPDLPVGEAVVAGDERIVVFLEDNRRAGARIEALRRAAAAAAEGDGGLLAPDLEILHVNCGFLPSSVQTWRPAWEMVVAAGARGDDAGSSWLHLHENVGVADVEGRKEEVQGMFDGWAREKDGDGACDARVEHVELVKTFAPGVWHCVFDVRVTRRRISTGFT